MVRRLFNLAICLVLVSASVLNAETVLHTETTLRGTVLKVGGHALVEAQVEVAPLGTSFEFVLALLESRHAELGQTVTADVQGRFVVQDPGPGVWQVKVTAPGFLPMRYTPLPLANPVDLPAVALHRATMANIVVTNVAGEPLAGIGVFVQSADPDVLLQPEKTAWRPAPRFGWTDASGQLSLPRARGERLDVWAHQQGHTIVAHVPGVRDAKLILMPPPPSTNTIVVQEPSGAPIANTIVTFGETFWPLGRTNQAGDLSLQGAHSSSLRLVYLASGSRTHFAKPQGSPMTAASNTDPSSATVVLPPVMQITGQIRDREGRPIAGALVWPGHDPGAFTRSDAGGRYRLPGGALERVRVQAHAHGFVPQSRRLTRKQASTSAVDLELVRAVTLAGRVVDEEGEAIRGARLRVAFQGKRQSVVRPDPMDSRSISDALGQFRLPNLTPDATYTLTVVQPGFNTSTQTVKTTSTGEELVVLRRGRIAFGRVLDLEERPLAGIEVQLRATNEGSNSLVAVSDAAGRFEIRALPANHWDLVARGQGFAPLAVRGIQAPPGEAPVDLGTLILEPGVTLHGQVRDRGGAAVAGAAVWIVEDPLQALRRRAADKEEAATEADAVANEHGQFVLEGLEPGRGVSFFVDGAGYLPAIVERVKPLANNPVEVVLNPASQLSGQIVDENGGVIAKAEISLHPASRATLQEVESGEPTTSPERFPHIVASDEQGHFVLEDVAPGAVHLEVYASGFQPASQENLAVVEEQNVDNLRFVLRRGAVLEGRVTTADFVPVAGARIFLGRPQDHSSDDGAYRVEGIPTGRQYVEVRHPGFNRLVQELEIEPGANAADFVLEGGHRISGYVVDTSNQPVADVEVELEPVVDETSKMASFPGETHRVTSDARGDFRVHAVADGAYLVRAHRRGFVEAQSGQLIRIAGPTEDVEILLQAGARIEGQILGLELEDLSRLEIRAEAEGRGRRAGEVDFEGHYEIADLGADDWIVKAFLAGGQREVQARVAIEPGVAMVNRDLEFGRGAVLTGQVLFADTPLADTRVEVRGHDVPVRRSVTTDFEGQFRVEDLTPGNYRLSLSNHRERLIHNEDLPITDDRDVVIEIAPTRFEGVVIDSVTGEGVVDALVAVKQLLPGNQEGSLFTVPTNAEGRFSVDRLTGGRFHVTVQRNDYQTTEQQVELAAGSVPEPLRVMLDPAAGLEVMAELGSGKKPAYLTLYGRDDNGRVFSETRQAADGQVPFTTLPAGHWNLLIGATGGALVETRHTVPGEPLALVVPDAGRVRVRVPALVETDTIATLTVLGPDNQPFRHLAWGGALEQSWRVVGGRATVDGIPAGLWTFQVQASSGEIWSNAAATTGGPDVEINLE